MIAKGFSLLLAAGLLVAALPAHAVYRCEVDGKIVYGDAPCPGGQPVKIEAAPEIDEARRRAEREKKQLEEIERNAAREAKAKRKEQRRAERVQAAQERRCEKLEKRVEWAQEEARRATGKTVDKARRKAERVETQYETECSEVVAKRGQLTGVSTR